MDDSTTRNEEIKEALDSLASIKASIRGNMQLIRPVIHNRAFVRFLGFCFSGTSVLFLLYLIRNLVWARRTAPFWFKPVVIIFLILFLTAAILWKISVLDRELRSTTKTIGLWGTFQNSGIRFAAAEYLADKFSDAWNWFAHCIPDRKLVVSVAACLRCLFL
jgi:hypothetical protein